MYRRSVCRSAGAAYEQPFEPLRRLSASSEVGRIESHLVVDTKPIEDALCSS